jgi:hypothetical protein
MFDGFRKGKRTGNAKFTWVQDDCGDFLGECCALG